MLTCGPPLNISCPCPHCTTFLLPIPSRKLTKKRLPSPLIITSFNPPRASDVGFDLLSPRTATLSKSGRTQLLSPLVLGATKISTTPHLLSPFVPKTPGPARCTFGMCSARVEIRVGGEWGNKLCRAHAGELKRCVGDMVRDWEGRRARKRGVVSAGRGSERKVLGLGIGIGGEKEVVRAPVSEEMRTRRRVGEVWGLESRRVGECDGEESD
jgi:hypothetical protein